MGFWDFVLKMTEERSWLGAELHKLADAINEANRERRHHDFFLAALRDMWSDGHANDGELVERARAIADRAYPPPPPAAPSPNKA